MMTITGLTRLRLSLGWAVVALSGCTGSIGGMTAADDPGAPADGTSGRPGGGTTSGGPGVSPGGGPAVASAADGLASAEGFGPAPLRRLSRTEYRRTVMDLLGIDPDVSLDLIPPDPATPFDNDAPSQVASAAWIEGAKAVADRTAAALVAQPARLAALLPCTPTGPADTVCLGKFVEIVGSRALRRPLSAEETDRYVAVSKVSAVAENNFSVGVEVLLRAWLQNLEFLYRVEMGTPVSGHPDLRALTPYELASRLSYLLWGSMPGPELLARVSANKLLTGPDLRAAALQLLTSPRAREQVLRIHAMWLGYEKPSGTGAIAAGLRQESDALVGKVIFDDKSSWFDLFTATSTFADDALAKHYGLPAPGPGAPRWIPYSGPGDRRGLLSHGSLLANGLKFGDTSPVQRGLWVRRRLMCQDIPPPPPELGVAVDDPPKGLDAKACKKERYLAHSSGACAGCHARIDPIGFGLEAFDALGRFRTTEPDRADCPISGQGALEGESGPRPFSGPSQLADRLMDSGRLDACFSEKLMRFVRGRASVPGEPLSDEAATLRFRNSDRRVLSLLVDLAGSEAFRHRSLLKDVTP